MKNKIIAFLGVSGILLAAYLFLSSESQDKEAKPAARSLASKGQESKPNAVDSSSVTQAQTTGQKPDVKVTSTGTSETTHPGDAQSDQREITLKKLQSVSTRPWDVRRDGFSDEVRTLEGGLLPNVSFESFVEDYSLPLFGVPSENLYLTVNEITDRTKVVFIQKVNGLEVYGGTLTLFYEGNSLTRVQNDLTSKEKLLTDPKPRTAKNIYAFLETTSQQSAQALGEKYLPTIKAPILPNGATVTPLKMFLYPSSSGLVHVYQIPVQEEKPGLRPEKYLVIIEAENMRVVARKPYHVE